MSKQLAELPLRCLLCKGRPDDCPPVVTLQVPLLSANAAFPAKICSCCNEKLWVMMLDIPWIRYQMSQYINPHNRPGYAPDGRWFMEDPR